MKNWVLKGIVTVIVVILMYSVANNWYHLQDLIREKNDTPTPYIKLTIYGLFIGILVEWYSLKSIFQGHIKVNWLLAPALVFLVLAFIPDDNWFKWFGVGRDGFEAVIAPFRFRESQMAFDIVTGILLIRSFTTKE
ncbi:hypothetical protein GLW05_18890 [Pontibacillus yanchengensis]|uniref:Uncharacterized protein n=1 Tax=Pontibacillus yanchengensis TaxID=462910 RepID=A0A6I5A5P8_9BACI|nr:hypothetical protein [Pontibacillus yanchengensis]MYL35647.1 hypothetical protein [Pontibacillus yanchengensis]